MLEENWGGLAQKRELGLCSRNFFAEIYGTVGDKVIEAMNGTGVPYKIFNTKFGYSRV